MHYSSYLSPLVFQWKVFPRKEECFPNVLVTNLATIYRHFHMTNFKCFKGTGLGLGLVSLYNTHTLDQEKLVKISSNPPHVTNFTNDILIFWYFDLCLFYVDTCFDCKGGYWRTLTSSWGVSVRNNGGAGLLVKWCYFSPFFNQYKTIMFRWRSRMMVIPWKKYFAHRHYTHRTQSIYILGRILDENVYQTSKLFYYPTSKHLYYQGFGTLSIAKCL